MYRFIELHDPEPKYYYGIGEAVDLCYELKTEVDEDQKLYQVELLAQHSKGRVDEGTFPKHLDGDVTGNEQTGEDHHFLPAPDYAEDDGKLLDRRPESNVDLELRDCEEV